MNAARVVWRKGWIVWQACHQYVSALFALLLLQCVCSCSSGELLH